MKKIVSILLIIMMLCLNINLLFAEDNSTISKPSPENCADDLKYLGLFKGTDKGYELERQMTRTEAVVMLIRLLGKEAQALETTDTHHFTDVPEWANKYVAFAYNNDISNGISKDKFGANDYVNSAQFLTFILRAMDYSDAVVISREALEREMKDSSDRLIDKLHEEAVVTEEQIRELGLQKMFIPSSEQ